MKGLEDGNLMKWRKHQKKQKTKFLSLSMKKISFPLFTVSACIIFFIFFACTGGTQGEKFPIIRGPYLGQKSPGKIPEVFASKIISSEEYHEGCSGFMKDGAVFIFSPIIPGSDWKYKPTYFMQLKDAKWTKPKIIPFNDLSPYNFTVAPDGKTLYFTSG